MIRARSLAGLLAAWLVSSGCNLIFGINGGQPGGGTGAGGSGATGATGGGGATGGATGGGGNTGGGGSMGCPPVKPAQCDAKYLEDAANCCVAGRSCGKGECHEGECTPALIGMSAAGEEGIGVVVAGDHVVWASGYGHAMYRVDLEGTTQETIFPPEKCPFQTVTMLAVDPEASPQDVYFTDYSGADIGRAPVNGGTPEVFAHVPDAANITRYGSILVHGDFVYWAMQRESVGDPGDPGKDIWRAKRQPDGSATVTAEKVALDDQPLSLAADEAYLYFGDSKQGNIARIAWGALDEGATLPVTPEVSGALDEGATLPVTPEVLVANAFAAGQGSVDEIAVDDQFIYWGSGTILLAADKSQPSASGQVIHPSASYLGGIVADGRDVYFTNLGDGSTVAGELWRKPKGLSDKFPKKLFQAPPDPGSGKARSIPTLTHDCTSVYFMVREGGELWKLTK